MRDIEAQVLGRINNSLKKYQDGKGRITDRLIDIPDIEAIVGMNKLVFTVNTPALVIAACVMQER